MLVASGVLPVGVTTVSVPYRCSFWSWKAWFAWFTLSSLAERGGERQWLLRVSRQLWPSYSCSFGTPRSCRTLGSLHAKMYHSLFNLSSFVKINFFSSPSFHLFLPSLLLRVVPWGPCSPSDLGAPLFQWIQVHPAGQQQNGMRDPVQPAADSPTYFLSLWSLLSTWSIISDGSCVTRWSNKPW